MNQLGDRISRGVVQIANDSDRVTDVDEEAGAKQDTDNFRGLGHVDSRKDTMSITFELKAPIYSTTEPKTSRSQRARKSQKSPRITDKTVQIELSQDKTALRSRKGDTGSVVWKARLEIVVLGLTGALFKDLLVLQQLHTQAPDGLLNPHTLNSAHVLELGAGTGLLAIAFAPHVGHYTVTDIEALQPLIRKNITANFPGWPEHCVSPTPKSNVSAEELDWVFLSNTVPTQRGRIVDIAPADLILVVDCIYHPSLLPPLVETINYLTVPGRTAVLVVVELRAEDVVREFLSLWLERPGWEIWRVGGGLLEGPYAMWLGWRSLSP
ncbi:hypothetical protein C0991_002658 [Blastosporella zonata]|nr:hypothetical protein C0991_002658 [Blastosporella zonata]